MFTLKFLRNRNWPFQRILLIGYNEISNFFRQTIESSPRLGYHFIGYVKYDTRDMNEIPEKDRSYVLGNTSQLKQIIEENDIQAVFSTFSLSYDKVNRDKEKIEEQLMVCHQMGTQIYLISENQRWARVGYNVEAVGPFRVLNLRRIPLDHLRNRLLKRSFDIFFSLLVILCFGWNLLPLIIGIIKWTSKGPAFFVQERTGLNNLPFRCYKFRSMYINEESDKKQATKDDSRITPFGHFMRKWNIDELPQFFNVLCGQMSVVGPRPHMLSQTEQYSALIKHYNDRHYVKPGITGWAQVNGWRGETEETWKMENRVKYDIEYIKKWSFSLDLKIIWMTIFGKNAHKNAG